MIELFKDSLNTRFLLGSQYLGNYVGINHGL